MQIEESSTTKSIGSILTQKNVEKNYSAPKNKFQATRHQELAVSIAEEFNDIKHIGIYMRACKKHPESYIRYLLATIRELKPNNPGAYFTKLINKK